MYIALDVLNSLEVARYLKVAVKKDMTFWVSWMEAWTTTSGGYVKLCRTFLYYVQSAHHLAGISEDPKAVYN